MNFTDNLSTTTSTTTTSSGITTNATGSALSPSESSSSANSSDSTGNSSSSGSNSSNDTSTSTDSAGNSSASGSNSSETTTSNVTTSSDSTSSSSLNSSSTNSSDSVSLTTTTSTTATTTTSTTTSTTTTTTTTTTNSDCFSNVFDIVIKLSDVDTEATSLDGVKTSIASALNTSKSCINVSSNFLNSGRRLAGDNEVKGSAGVDPKTEKADVVNALNSNSFQTSICKASPAACKVKSGEATKKTPWKLRLSQMGCSNMASIALEDSSVVDTASKCGERCNSTSGCIGFGYQSQDKSVCTAGGGDKGSCYLWKAPCLSVPNQCMDDYILGEPALCTSLTCPAGFSSKQSTVPLYCSGSVCDTVVDKDTCCASNGACATMACPDGYSANPNARSTVCKAGQCNVANDLDTCCQQVGKCSTMQCPAGMGLVSNAAVVSCGSNPCSGDDWAACCIAQASCTSFTCQPGYTGKPNAENLFCDGEVCTSADNARCCDQQSSQSSAQLVMGGNTGNPALRAASAEATTTSQDTFCPALETTCDTIGLEPPLSHREVGEFIVYSCPGQCTTGKIYGTDVYTPSSRLCAAAVFSGVISSGGGFIKVRLAPGLPMYTGGFRNGVESLDHGATEQSLVMSVPSPEDFCNSNAITTTTDMPWGLPWWAWLSIVLVSLLILCLPVLLAYCCCLGGKSHSDDTRKRSKKQYQQHRERLRDRDDTYALEADPLYNNSWHGPPPSNVHPPLNSHPPPSMGAAPMGTYAGMYPGQGSVGPGSFSYAPPVLTAGPGAGYIQFPGGGPPVPIQSNPGSRRGSWGSGGMY